MDDSGDEAGADAHGRGATWRLAPSAAAYAMGVPPLVGPMANSRFNAMDHGQLSWVARQMRRQSEAAVSGGCPGIECSFHSSALTP